MPHRKIRSATRCTGRRWSRGGHLLDVYPRSVHSWHAVIDTSMRPISIIINNPAKHHHLWQVYSCFGAPSALAVCLATIMRRYMPCCEWSRTFHNTIRSCWMVIVVSVVTVSRVTYTAEMKIEFQMNRFPLVSLAWRIIHSFIHSSSVASLAFAFFSSIWRRKRRPWSI